MLNFELSDARKKLQAQAREFSLKHVLPEAWSADEHDTLPVHVLKKAFHDGLMNSDIPKEYGGKGYGLVEGAIITKAPVKCKG